MIAWLPTLNATLNGIAATFLVAGYVFIRRRHVGRHRAMMLAAFCTSVLFLLSYTVYHSQAASRPYEGTGILRPVYFTILVSHIVLAAAVPPLALVTLVRAWRGRYALHARLARRTLPIWLYVSVTGVLVYLMLYSR